MSHGGPRPPRIDRQPQPAIGSLHSSRSRAERFIAAGRVVLALASLVGVWLDPEEPSRFVATAYTLLLAYLLYAIVAAVYIFRSRSPADRQKLLTQAIDLSFFSLFTYFTAGPLSPFIAYFVFSIVCGTLRWRFKGALGTAAVALAAYIVLSVWSGEVARNPEFHLDRFVIRSVYLAVIALLLGYLGVYEERTRRETALLAAWPRKESTDLRLLTQDLASYASLVTGAPRTLMIWDEREEPWLRAALWSGGTLGWDRLPAHDLEPLVTDPASNGGFLCGDARKPSAAPLPPSRDATAPRRGQPIHPGLVERYDISTVLAVPIRGAELAGWIFFLDQRGLTADDLELATIVGGIISARLEHHFLLEGLRDAAATEERFRVARDLHDGVLQSLAGIALQVAAAGRQAAEDPTQTRRALEEVGRLIAIEQQDLRFFIEELKPRLGQTTPPLGLAERLKELADRAGREWNLQVDIAVAALPETVSDPLARQIYLIVREALTNAARHGGASRVTVRTTRPTDDRLGLDIADDGRGFPFHGRFTQNELAANDLGPRSLRERVASLRGELVLESGPSGSRLDIAIPRGAGWN